MIPPWSAYVPDRDRPDPHASPIRYDYLSRDEQEVRQALADWFQAVPVFSETRNVHTAESLLGTILSKLPLDEEGMDPELLRKGWMAAAGPFLGKQACLVSLVKGVATVQVIQPLTSSVLPSPGKPSSRMWPRARTPVRMSSMRFSLPNRTWFMAEARASSFCTAVPSSS